MTECQKYLEILLDSLEKKIGILDQLLAYNEKQGQIIKENLNMDEFDLVISQKAELIQALTRLDAGFQAIYDRIREEFLQNKELYKNEIVKLQQAIGLVSDKSIEVEASEARNKKAVETYFSYTRSHLQQNRKNVRAASDYYKSMSQMNFVDSQMIDKKK